MADERDVFRPTADDRDTLRGTAAEDRDTPVRDKDPGHAKPPKSPPPQPYHTATALASLESRLEQSETRRIDSEERVRQLEKIVDGLMKQSRSSEPAAARAGVSEPAEAWAGVSELDRQRRRG